MNFDIIHNVYINNYRKLNLGCYKFLTKYVLLLEMLQKILEKPLEKKAGRNYGPPGGKTLIYFIDDINMPEVSFNLI